MLSTFRKFFKSWAAGAVMVLLLISVGIWGVSDVFKAGTSNSVVVAGSRKLSAQEYRRRFDQTLAAMEKQYQQKITPEDAVKAGLDRQALDQAARQEAMSEAVRRLGVVPGPLLVVEEIRKIPAFFDQISGRFDKTTYANLLAQERITAPIFEGMMRDELAQNHFVSAVMTGVKAPLVYGAVSSASMLEKRTFSYFVLDAGKAGAAPKPTEADLKAFMQENAERLRVPELRHLTLVRFSAQEMAPKVKLDDAKLKELFDFRKDSLSKPETRSVVQIPAKDQAKAADAVRRLKAGEAPEAVAKALGVEVISYVDKPKTAVADRKLADAAFALPAGGVSEPVQTAVGYAAVKVTKVTPGRTATLEEVRPMLESEFKRTEALRLADEAARKYEEAVAKGANLNEAAKVAGVTPTPAGPAAKPGANQPIEGPAAIILDAAFSLGIGEESDILEVGDGQYAVVRVDKIIPPSMRPLEEVRAPLTKAWVERETARRLKDLGKTIVGRIEKGETMEAAAAAVGARVVKVEGLDRRNARAKAEEIGGPALDMAFGGKPKDVSAVDGPNGQTLIVRLDAVVPGDPKEAGRSAPNDRSVMSRMVAQDLGEAVRAGASRVVEVKTNEKLARQAIGVAEDAPTDKAADKAKGR